MKRIFCDNETSIYNVRKGRRTRSHLVVEGCQIEVCKSTTDGERTSWRAFCDKYGVVDVYPMVSEVLTKVVGCRGARVRDEAFRFLVMGADKAFAIKSSNGNNYLVVWLLTEDERRMLEEHGELNPRCFGSYGGASYEANLVEVMTPSEGSFGHDVDDEPYCAAVWSVKKS